MKVKFIHEAELLYPWVLSSPKQESYENKITKQVKINLQRAIIIKYKIKVKQCSLKRLIFILVTFLLTMLTNIPDSLQKIVDPFASVYLRMK